MNSDIHQNIALRPEVLDWQKSGLYEKALLDQVGWESSFIRLAPETVIRDTELSLGEEYLVLDGSIIFNEEVYPTGSYLRFPPPTQPALRSGANGARLFLKHNHFKPTDKTELHIKEDDQAWRQGMVPGLSVMPLYQHQHESIALVKWAANTQFNSHVHPGGEEIIVLEGTFYDEFGCYPTGTWMRNKPYSSHTPYTQSDGALIYVKTGHLPPIQKQ